MTVDAETQETELVRSALAGGSLRDLILELWQRTRIDWSYATEQLSQAFRRERRLGGAERRFVAETLYGMIRHLRRVDEALRAGGFVDGTRGQDELRLVAYWTLEAGLSSRDAARHFPDIDWGVVRAIDDALAREKRPARRIALMHSFPDWLAERLVRDLGDQAEAVAAALNQRAPMTVRANLLVNDAAQLERELAEGELGTTRGRFSDTALIIDTRVNLFALAPFKRGAFEAQDEASQLVADLVAPPPKARVVDYCAGAGGKTLAIAARMGSRGRIVAADVSGRKLNELRKRARRAGVSNIQSVQLEGDHFPAALERLVGKAHRVLVDAPCTGVGALRRNPEARWRMQPDDLDRLPRQQLQIARRAAELVSPGGRLIYATCTMLAAENRGVVEAFLAAEPSFTPMSVKEIWGAERASEITDETGTYLEMFPHRHGTDGFFAAVLRKLPGSATLRDAS